MADIPQRVLDRQGNDPAAERQRAGRDLGRALPTLGVTEQLPLDDRHLYGQDYLTESLAVRLGGRAAELVEFGQGSTGAASDLAGATDLATKMVREFSLSPALGPVDYPEGGSVFLGGDDPGLSSRPFAEATQATIDGGGMGAARRPGLQRDDHRRPRRPAPGTNSGYYPDPWTRH